MRLYNDGLCKYYFIKGNKLGIYLFNVEFSLHLQFSYCVVWHLPHPILPLKEFTEIVILMSKLSLPQTMTLVEMRIGMFFVLFCFILGRLRVLD